MAEEVRYHMLRPAQAVEKRTAFPAAYIPIGTIEWHGPHNPLGADTLQAEALAIRCAEKGGGLVFPPLYYGETRVESLVEANAADREDIARCMQLSPDNFTPDKMPFSATEQVHNYNKLLLHILAEVESLGFKLAVLVAGHYPLVDHACAAALLFNKRRYSKYHGMLAWACCDYLLVDDKYATAGDHGGGWETSHILATHPETVDLSLLPPKGENIVGVGVDNRIPPQDATAEFGEETFTAACDVVVAEVRHRMENLDFYKQHGKSMKQGLWKNK